MSFRFLLFVKLLECCFPYFFGQYKEPQWESFVVQYSNLFNIFKKFNDGFVIVARLGAAHTFDILFISMY